MLGLEVRDHFGAAASSPRPSAALLSAPACRGVPSKQEGLAATRAALFAGDHLVAGEESLDAALRSGGHDRRGFHLRCLCFTGKDSLACF